MKTRATLETYLLIAINLWFAYIVSIHAWNTDFIHQLGAVSGNMPTEQLRILLVPLTEDMAIEWMRQNDFWVRPLAGIPLFIVRTLNASFLHFSWGHLFGNAVSLWIIGKRYEQVNYRGTFTLIYVFTGIISMSSAAILQPYALTAGASGAVFGLMGASYVLSKRAERLAFKRDMPHSTYVKYSQLGHLVYSLMVYNLIMTFVLPGISIVGHISGLIAGIIIGIIIPIKYW